MDTQNDSLGRADAMSVKKEIFLTVNEKWIKISYEWADRYRNNESIVHINNLDYLDILGLYETCWLSYEFDDEDKPVFGYPK